MSERHGSPYDHIAHKWLALIERRQENANEDRDDANHREKLDEGECFARGCHWKMAGACKNRPADGPAR